MTQNTQYQHAMSSRYSSGVVVVQAGSRPSTYSAPRSLSSSTTYSSSYAQTTFSMDSSSASRSTTEARYRSGSSGESLPHASDILPLRGQAADGLVAGFYTDVKEVPNSRGGSNLVVVQHNRANPDKNEPRSYSGSSYGKK